MKSDKAVGAGATPQSASGPRHAPPVRVSRPLAQPPEPFERPLDRGGDVSAGNGLVLRARDVQRPFAQRRRQDVRHRLDRLRVDQPLVAPF